MSSDSVLDDLRPGIRLTDAPQDRTSYVPPWTTVVAPSLSLDATTATKALSFGPLGTPARLTSGASLARSPSIWADDTPSMTLSLGTERIPRRDLHSALVHASCRSNTWGELAPPSLDRHPLVVSAHRRTESSPLSPLANLSIKKSSDLSRRLANMPPEIRRFALVLLLICSTLWTAQPAILRSRTPPLSRLLSHRLTSMRSTFVRLNANSPNRSLKRINPD